MDHTFRGNDTVFWDGFTDAWNMNYYIEDHEEWFRYERWSDIYPDIGLFDEDGTIDWTEAMQGGLGTCYILSLIHI